MALRAGYFGLKRFERNKLSILAASMPADISPDNPIAGKNDVLASVSLLGDTVGWIGRNLFNGKATTMTGQGVTWTVNESDNNIVTASGTATGFEAFTIDSNNVLPVGEYVLSGISDMVNVVYNGVYLFKGSTQVRDLHIEDNNAPHTFSILQSDDYDTIRVQLKRQTNGVACSGTGKNMITTPEQYALDNTYESYHASVAEILNTKVDKEPVVLSNADDINNIWNIGIDYSWGGSIPANAPENHGYCSMRVVKSSPSVFKQIIIYGMNLIYMREKNGDTINNFYKFTGTEVTPPSPTPENETKKATKKKVIKEEEE